MNTTTLSNASNRDPGHCDAHCRTILITVYGVVLLGGTAGAVTMSCMMFKRNSQSMVAVIVLNILVLHSILLVSLPFRLSYYVLVVWEFGTFTCRLYGIDPSYSEQQRCFEFYKDLSRREFITLNYSMIVILMTTVVTLFLIQTGVILQLAKALWPDLWAHQEYRAQIKSFFFLLVIVVCFVPHHAFRAVINNQSLWDEMLQNKGLTVIDVYQAWCGPCKAMQTLFRKLKNEVNEDEILHFAVNGKIVAKIKGANAPLVNQKIITLINEERKIAAGEMVRPQYHEVAFADSDAEDAGEAAYESVEQVYSIVIIKPDAVVASKVLEIKDKIINAQFVIEAEDKRLLTEEQVKYFYSQLADQPDFEDFVSFMTSGLSYILVISQGKEQQPPWDKSDPNSEAEPKEPLDDQQETARAMGMMQKLERIKGKLPNKQLATEAVLNIIEDEGFKILMQRQIVLSREEAETLCKEHENKDYFESLIENMTRGPSLIMILTKWNAVSDWRRLMGPIDPEEAKLLSPDSIRAQFGRSILKNAVHGASNVQEAMDTINRMFEEFVAENPEEN
ncbi:thioredoxin domain-containing protein 3 [Camelus ferus]|nr:thioredoxin domain-containing protein 3 [Camelus ferus]